MMKKIQKIGQPKLNKKTAVMAVAAVTAAAVAATGIYGLVGRVQDMDDVYAKESFAGMKEIVEEHDKGNPFKILDITPTKAMYIMGGSNAKTYNLSTGTIGYLTGGQAPIEKDIYDIFHDNTAFYDYEERQALAKAIVPSGFDNADFLSIAYEEAYGGTIDGLDGSRDWIKLYDSVVADGPLDPPTGQLRAYVTKITDADKDAGKYGEYKLVKGTVTVGLDEEGIEGDIFKFNQDSGEWHLTFAYDADAVIGYVPTIKYCGDLSSCSNTTGVYYKNDDGTYEYVGTKADVLGLPQEDKKPSDDDKDKPEEGKKPEGSTGDENPDKEGEGGDNPDKEGEGDDNPDKDGEGDDNTGNQGEGGDNTGSGDGEGDDNTGSGDGDNTGSGNGEGDDNTGNEDGGNTGNGDESSGSAGSGDSSSNSSESTNDSGSSDSNEADESAAADAVWRLLIEDGESEETEEESEEESGEEEKVEDSDIEDTDDSDQESDTDDEEEEPKSQDAGSRYYVLEFYFETNPSEDTVLYRIKDKTAMSEWDSEIIPLDRYDFDDSFTGMIEEEEGAEADEETDGDVAVFDTGSTNLPILEYVGKEDEDGEYNLQMAYAGDANYDDAQEVVVQNAPVYFRCCKGNNWLEEYVFNALEDQDNYYDQFTIEVNCISADEVSVDDVQEADLIYLEHGDGIFINSGAAIQTIAKGEGNGGLSDMPEEVALAIVNRAVTELLPVIVDYDIITSPGPSDQYKDSNYYNLARVFLKEDLAGFYENTGEKDKLADLFNNLESDDFEDNEDNDCHYVNRNIYMVNGDTPLVSDDFPKSFDGDEAKRGFREVLIAIRAENTMLKEEDWLEDEVSKARAIAYIINYSVGMIGDYRDVSILELQPSANLEPDLHVDNNEDRKTTTLYWQKKDSGESGQQIFRSTKIVDVDRVVKSVAEFNGEWADINSAYDMIFIGLDGQLLNREGRDKHTVYNDSELNGLVYHTGDTAYGKDARYDASDITEQKKEALLDYLRAGYPVVVENNCLNVKKSDGEQFRSVNTRYIADNTQMYAFLNEALDQYGDYLYTVREVRGNPEFRAQLNVVKPRIDYQDPEQASLIQSLERTEDGKYEGTILYRITGNQEQKNEDGEEGDNEEVDNTYHGDTSIHLYLDLNYDGFFAPSEELYPTGEIGGYVEGDGQVTVSFEGVESGIIPWKLEVSDANNGYRRDAMMGYFTIQGQVQLPVNVLQVLDDAENQKANLQTQFEKLNNATLSRYLEMAENKLNVKYEFETITSAQLGERIAQNGNYLNQWDVLVLGFGNSGSLGAAQDAVTAYINEGRSVLISYAGATEDTGRLGLDIALLGQSNDMTYSKLGRDGGAYYRYEGLDRDMFADPMPSLQAQKINEGSITCYPFEVGGELGSAFFGDVTTLMAPEYLLDFANNTKDSDVHVTGWYTLNDNSSEGGGGYRVSPRDARNNYYIYSKANVVYVGQNEYPYFYEKDNGEEPKDGVDECKLFVNALTAAYNAGIHNPKVDIVAGFGASATSVESIPIPFDQEFKLNADTEGGILDETVDVYFKFVDNNIAFNKVTKISFYYENGGNPDAELVLADGSINEVDFTPFGSQVWMVENNRLVEVTDGLFRQGVVYRIKAPVVALKGNDEEVSRIFIALDTRYMKGGKERHAIGTDVIALTRAQMFLLE